MQLTTKDHPTNTSLITDTLTVEKQLSRALAEQLLQPVGVIIDYSQRYQHWNYLVGYPVNLDGSRIDISTTRFSVDQAEGYFDDIFVALFDQSDTKPPGGEMIQFSYGATDAPFIGWVEQYNLPGCLIDRKQQCIE
ncbi:MAG: hypothetical protein KTR32_26660 [Granulosicoccus sp.]|nr:hypothetical protein [Granulosicoccus sp.]